MRMRMLERTVVATVIVAALLAPAAPARAADVGDGRLACNRGEICFQWLWDGFITSTWQKHFWWSNWRHDLECFCNPPPLYPVFPLRNEASGFWNRDTQCYVRLWDVDSGGWHYYAQIPRDLMGNFADDRNDAHSRCG
jgi:hypothetical protein